MKDCIHSDILSGHEIQAPEKGNVHLEEEVRVTLLMMEVKKSRVNVVVQNYVNHALIVRTRMIISYCNLCLAHKLGIFSVNPKIGNGD